MNKKTKKEKLEMLEKTLVTNKHNRDVAEANIEELEAYIPVLKKL